MNIKLTQQEAQFIVDLLNKFPHQGTAQQLDPIIAMTNQIMTKLVAAANGVQVNQAEKNGVDMAEGKA